MTDRLRPWLSALAIGATACSASVPDREARPSSARLAVDTVRGEVLATDGDRGSVAIARLQGDAPVSEVAVGRDPARILRHGDTVYVSLRGQRALAVLGRSTGGWTFEHEIPVGAEPIGMALDRDAGRLYVANSLSDDISEITLSAPFPERRLPVTGHPRSLALHPAGGVLYVGSEQAGVQVMFLPRGDVRRVVLPELTSPTSGRVLTARLTGDIALSPDGARLTVPVLLIDDFMPLDALDVTLQGGGYGSAAGTPRFNPALIDVELTELGEPAGPVTVTPLVSGFGRRGQPTAIAYDTSGESLWVTFEGEADVYRLPADPQLRIGEDGFLPQGWYGGAPYSDGIAVVGDEDVVTTSVLTRGVSRLGLGALTTSDAVPLGALLPSPLSLSVQRGRELFVRADEPSMSAGGLSCATCHYEGRTDGITWMFDRGARQTPSLAEKVAERAPLRWGGDRATITEDTMLTSQQMGGSPPLDWAQDVEAYVVSIRGVDLPLRDAGADLALGRAAFEQAGCATCHNGELFSDQAKHALPGRGEVKTPSLLGVAATAPFLYDGSAPTLRALVARSDELGHGSLDGLTEAQQAELVRYLGSL